MPYNSQTEGTSVGNAEGTMDGTSVGTIVGAMVGAGEGKTKHDSVCPLESCPSGHDLQVVPL